jgi:hypothetical protein
LEQPALQPRSVAAISQYTYEYGTDESLCSVSSEMKDGRQNLILKLTSPEPNTSDTTHILQMLSLQLWSPYGKDT